MQEFMETYNNNVNVIENFLIETIKNVGSLDDKENSLYESLFDTFPSLDLVYACDGDNYLQVSPNIYRDKTTQAKIGISREYLISKLNVNTKEISISKPYMSAATGTTCITVAKKENGKIYFLDFDLLKLLQRLGLVEIHKQFNLISKSFYTLTSGILMVLALFTIGYALFDLVNSIFIKSELSIESIFKPVIALTLGLAIFDLAKTVMEQEVVFKSYAKNSNTEYKVLVKFSITIIIALLIESLMVVFKIAIADYHQMLYALYLILGVSVLVLTLGLFIFLTKEKD
jgi:hypothetical protein